MDREENERDEKFVDFRGDEKSKRAARMRHNRTRDDDADRRLERQKKLARASRCMDDDMDDEAKHWAARFED